MTALSDIRRMAKSVSRGNARDEAIFLRYYGADGLDPGSALARTELAAQEGMTRQGIHAKIKRLLCRASEHDLAKIRLSDTDRDLMENAGTLSARSLGGASEKGARRFYRDLLGIAPRSEPEPPQDTAPIGRIPAAQFDAMAKAAYGHSHAATIAAVRLILVKGMRPERAAREAQITESLLRKTAREIEGLHRRGLDAYAA